MGVSFIQFIAVDIPDRGYCVAGSQTANGYANFFEVHLP